MHVDITYDLICICTCVCTDCIYEKLKTRPRRVICPRNVGVDSVAARLVMHAIAEFRNISSSILHTVLRKHKILTIPCLSYQYCLLVEDTATVNTPSLGLGCPWLPHELEERKKRVWKK